MVSPERLVLILLDLLFKKLPATPINPKELLYNVVRFYQESLKKSQEARGYLSALGLGYEDFFEKFKIGFADGSLPNAIPDEGPLREKLQEIGILNETGQETFVNCVLFPVFDTEGQAIQIFGYSLRSQNGQILSLPRPLQGVWNFEVFAKHREIIITRGFIDALTLYGIMHAEVIPLYDKGENFTPDQLTFFELYKPEKVFLALPSHESEEKVYGNITQSLSKWNIPCFRLNLPPDVSVNSFIHAQKHTKADFDSLLKEAEPIRVKLAGSGDVFVNNGLVEFNVGKMRYQVRQFLDEPYRLKVNIRAELSENNEEGGTRKFHVDVIDLYVYKTRKTFINACARMFELPADEIENDLGTILEYLEKMKVEEEIKARSKDEEKPYEMGMEEKEEALSFLKNPNILDETVKDYHECGFSGEDLALKLGEIISISRKGENPLSAVIISSAGSGKSRFMEMLASFVPEEEMEIYTRITPQTFFYKEKTSLSHKVIYMAEMEGIEGADYPLRELISAKVLKSETTKRDPISNTMSTDKHEVKGPIAFFVSTTDPKKVHYENQTRCFLFFMNETREQTRRVQELQRDMHTMEGLLREEEIERIKRLHKNAQRLLRKLRVVNCYAKKLIFPDHSPRTRRENEKYLCLIDAIALLRQYQKEVKVMERRGRKREYIEVELSDIKLANELMIAVQLQNLEEMTPPARELLELIRKMVMERSKALKMRPSEYTFLRRDIREYTLWSDARIKAHIKELEELEYLTILHGGKRGKEYQYELGYKAKDFKDSLLDVENLSEEGRSQRSLGKSGRSQGGKLGLNNKIYGEFGEVV